MELNLQPIELEGVSKERPLIIAGPCSAETEEQVISTATQLANKGIKIFRAGIWKPRTKPGGFEGIGVDGLAWMKRVKQETGMYVATEVATAKHAGEISRRRGGRYRPGASGTYRTAAGQAAAPDGQQPGG